MSTPCFGNLLLALPLLALMSTGCGGEPLEDAQPNLFTAMPSYKAHIKAILRSRCVVCHDSKGVRSGGVELDQYASAFSNRVRNACVSITDELVARFSDVLLPHPTDPPTALTPCKNWDTFSMPSGASSRLTASEQVLLVRWVETGAPR